MVSSVVTNQLSTVFANQVTLLMSYERQPLTDLTTQRDSVSVQSSIYTDINSKLKALQDAVDPLISTNAFSTMTIGRSASVTPSTTGKTLATATASSSAIAGDYTLNVISLAQAQSKAGGVQSNTDSALGKSGSLWLGGTGTAAAAKGTDTDSIITSTGVSSNVIAKGIKELGTGAYTIETRTSSDGVSQFRLKNADGTVMAIQDQSKTDTAMTDSWQAIPTSKSYDTGRGLALNFTGNVGASATVNYSAAGVKVDVSATDSLTDIATNINNTTQAEGHELQATIIGNQLVFTSTQTGTNHAMIFTDTTTDKVNTTGGSLGFTSKDLQSAQNADIFVNNLELFQQSNNNLTGIISGVSLNLASDAAGQQGVIHVNQDDSTVKTAVQSFVDQLNSVQTYIQSKSAVVVNSDQSYTRGPLADDNIFDGLRSDMFDMVMTPVANSGIYKSLNDLGITIDDNLKISISDSSKLDDALTNHFNDVTGLLDQVMGKFDAKLNNFTSSSGYVTTQANSFSAEIGDMNAKIAKMTDELTARQQQLVDQYGAMQAALTMLTYNAQTWASVYAGSLSLTSSSSTTSTTA